MGAENGVYKARKSLFAESDRLVYSGVRGDTVEIHKLIKTYPQGAKHLGVKLAYGTRGELRNAIVKRYSTLGNAVEERRGKSLVGVAQATLFKGVIKRYI